MNRIKGFTLIELIGVVVVLGILMLLVFPSILNNIKKTQGDITEAGKKILFSSTALYLNSKQDEYPLEEDGHYCITVQELLDAKKLESINLIPGVKETNQVEVKVENNKYTYTLNNNCKIKYLKEMIESDTSHIVKNTKVNGEVVNKVIGTREERLKMTNYVWYAGQLWKVLETNDTAHTIKLITAQSLTGIAYGETSNWSTSYLRKWLKDVFLESIEGTKLITNTTFCLDMVDTQSTTIESNYESSAIAILQVTEHTQVQNCNNKINERVGIMSFEDYVYANAGNKPMYTGDSFLDEDEFVWTLTPYDTTHMWMEWFQDPPVITVSLEKDFSAVNKDGYGVKPVVSIVDTAIIKSGNGTKSNPYILVGDETAPAGSGIANVKVGEYVYLDESNNPYPFTKEIIASGLSYPTTKDKVRYRVVKKNDDGSVKVERADILRDLPSSISSSTANRHIPYYYKEASDGCYYNSSEDKWYVAGCVGHNIFQVNGNTEEYAYQKSINIGDYLNSSANSFYSWYSDATKAMIKKETYHRYTAGYGKDYSNLNDNLAGTYPSITDDGDITTYVVLPIWGEMYSGNDINYSYWLLNRYNESNTRVAATNNHGRTLGNHSGFYSYGIRPVVTLKETVKIASGKGTMSEPYYLN